MSSKMNVQGGIGAALFSTLVIGCFLGLPAIMWYILLPAIVGFIVASNTHDPEKRAAEQAEAPVPAPKGPTFPDRPWEKE